MVFAGGPGRRSEFLSPVDAVARRPDVIEGFSIVVGTAADHPHSVIEDGAAPDLPTGSPAGVRCLQNSGLAIGPAPHIVERQLRPGILFERVDPLPTHHPESIVEDRGEVSGSASPWDIVCDLLPLQTVS